MFVAITSSSQEQDARCPQPVPADISVEGVHLWYGQHDDGSDDNEEQEDNDGDNTADDHDDDIDDCHDGN